MDEEYDYLEVVFDVAMETAADFGDEHLDYIEIDNPKYENLKKLFLNNFTVDMFTIYRNTVDDNNDIVRLEWINQEFNFVESIPVDLDIQKLSLTELLENNDLNELKNFISYWIIRGYWILYSNTDYPWMK